MFSVSFSCPVSVPSVPPFNITSTNTSSTSLLISWDHIPRILVNGILLGYRVFYHQSPPEQQIGARRRRRAISESLNETVGVVPPNKTFLRISSLKKFTNYSFRIVGFTIKGNGKTSHIFNVSTDEDSKLYNALTCCSVSRIPFVCRERVLQRQVDSLSSVGSLVRCIVLSQALKTQNNI